MSGIYIPGIEMPTSCFKCQMLEGDRMDGLCHAASRWLDDDEYWTWYVYPEGDIDDSKPCNCPLIPVPPHGRLIDADAIHYICGGITVSEMDYVRKYQIDRMPTIISADPDKEVYDGT